MAAGSLYPALSASTARPAPTRILGVWGLKRSLGSDRKLSVIYNATLPAEQAAATLNLPLKSPTHRPTTPRPWPIRLARLANFADITYLSPFILFAIFVTHLISAVHILLEFLTPPFPIFSNHQAFHLTSLLASPTCPTPAFLPTHILIDSHKYFGQI